MQETIELARGAITADAAITIDLVRRLKRGQITELIMFRWPSEPSAVTPSKLTTVTNAIIAALAEARIQLAAIRAREL
jgi:hypothetical protein